MRICIACSAGGHLAEMMSLAAKLKIKEKPLFFTFKIQDIEKTLKNYDFYLTINPKRNPIKFLKVVIDSIIFYFKYKPTAIITSGAGVIVPLCIFSKIFGTKLIFVETSSRITSPSLTSKILYPFADMFFVQWKSLLKHYGKKAVYGGLLI